MSTAPRVAVVEDDRLHLAMITEALTEAGYSVTAFSSAEDALKSLQENSADLVVTDIVLPHMNGFQLLSQLRQKSEFGQTPCIGVSGKSWTNPELHRVLDQLGPFQLLEKPLNLPQLLASVSKMLSLVAPVPKDLRAAPRSPVRLAVKLKTAHQIVAEYTDNLSHNGLFIATQTPLQVDSSVEIEISVPFRDQPVVATGRVVRAVLPDASTPHVVPGMALALERLPEPIKAEFRAYVEGVRAGIAAVGGSTGSRLVLFVGMSQKMPRRAAEILNRSELNTYWVDDLEQAATVVPYQPPFFVIVNGRLLARDPVEQLRRLNLPADCSLLVCADPLQREALSGQFEVVDAERTSAQLLNQLSRALHLQLRVHPRAECIAPVEARTPAGVIVGMLENVSLGGLSLVTRTGLELGQELTVSFQLPHGSGAITGSVRIVRVVTAGNTSDRVRVGAQFLDVTPTAFEALRQFVLTALEEQGDPRPVRQASPRNPFGL